MSLERKILSMYYLNGKSQYRDNNNNKNESSDGIDFAKVTKQKKKSNKRKKLPLSDARRTYIGTTQNVR